MEYTVSDPFNMPHYHEDFNQLVALEISDVIDFHDYHDAPSTIYISLNKQQLQKFVDDLVEKLEMMK